jgi:hypothetical protein
VQILYSSTNVTCQSWEVTQQTSEQHEQIPADDHQHILKTATKELNISDLISNYSDLISYNENSIRPYHATDQSWEVILQTSEQHEQTPADAHQQILNNATKGINNVDLTPNCSDLIPNFGNSS